MERQHYPAYLLRMWRVGPEPGDWRAMLENAATGERRGFASPQALCAWIWEQTQERVGDAAPFPMEETEQ